MRRGTVIIIAGLVALAGCGGDDEPAAELTATTSTSPPVTTPPATFSADMLDRADDCVDMQISAARSIALGTSFSEAERVEMEATCDDASDLLTAGGAGDTPPNQLAVQLAAQAVDLVSWETGATLGASMPSQTGATPESAGSEWRAKYVEITGA